MSPQDFRATLGRLGISQAALARSLGVNKQTPNRWAHGLAPIPRSVVLLLWAMESQVFKLEDFEKVPD